MNDMSGSAAGTLASGGSVSSATNTHKNGTMPPGANGPHPAHRLTKRIRPFVPEDISQVAELHKKVFPNSPFSDAELRSYFQLLFFENPWHDADLPSLVYQENRGKILGFYGVLPRPMRMQGRPIQAAVSSQFMVDPSVRNRLAAVELQNAFFAGPQDLSLTDGANEASRRVWEGLGGLTAFPYSVHWTRLLRPTRYLLERCKEHRLFAPLQLAMRPMSAAVDFLAAHESRSPFFETEQPREEDFAWETLFAHLPRFTVSKSLCPEYDERSMHWLLERAGEKRSHGKLRKSLVRNGNGQIVGWYMYYLNRKGTSQVLQLVATKDSLRLVLRQLFFHAWRLGSAAVSGRVDPEFATDLSQEHCLFDFNGPRLLVHSKRADLREAIERGDAFLTRLEGEWWMRFEGG